MYLCVHSCCFYPVCELKNQTDQSICVSAAQAWELLDPPSGWDQQGPVLASGYYQITPTIIQVAAVMDDAISDACSSGKRREIGPRIC
jgi:hypothetical protein